MFAEIKLSFVFLYNTGKAGHISTAMWDAEEAGPLECGMKIYENNMQISIVPVIQNKQTNDGNENDCASRRIPDSAYSVVQVWECVCVCVCLSACVRVCMHVFVRVTEEKQWDLNAPRKLALQLFFAMSWDPGMPSLVRNNNYYWDKTGLYVHSVVQKDIL